MAERTIRVLRDPAEISEKAAEYIIDAAAEAIALTGRFTLALSGGRTPKSLYTLLAAGDNLQEIDWGNVEIYFGDERTVPPEHADSNYRMAKEALLDVVPIPAGNIHRMKGEIDPAAAAIEYDKLLQDRFAEGAGLDLILLGMGDDGHTASLFPHTEALGETKHRCVANFVPQMKTWRITLSAPFINQSREVLVMVEGAGKAGRVAEVLEGPEDPGRLPIQMIRPRNKYFWLMDVAAAGM
ncbi:MAG TPA: 6-phosphogluconolactonase [Tepidisphaeraceae bacterium]|nr:6-phosphogluconolactonase [Tepidisphaeraceae bacterium]